MFSLLKSSVVVVGKRKRGGTNYLHEPDAK